jgi:flagellar biosynthesis/type III secretory pathway chaperone
MQAESIRTLLTEVETALAQLLLVHENRQLALARMDMSELELLARREQGWIGELDRLHELRAQILSDAGPLAGEPPSLRHLIASCPAEIRTELYSLVREVQIKTEKLRNLAVDNWLSSYSSSQFVSSLLSGIKFSSPDSPEEGSGRLFDSSA